VIHIGNIPANPTVSDVHEILNLLKNENIARIIAIGGGSCIDLAKAISALHTLYPHETISKKAVGQAIKNKEYRKPHSFIDIIAVPTTAGTGSEVTKWATIWDMDEKVKLSVDCDELFPKVALICPEFTLTMPKRLTLSTGLDALSHAMEAFWAKKRTPLSQELALLAVKKIKEFLPKALNDGNNLEYRKEMSLASLIAGLAFSITRTTAAHSMSYPLTIYHNIEHGFAVAATLIKVSEYNCTAVPEISSIYSLFGGVDGLKQWFKDISNDLVDIRLSTFGVTEQDLDLIVEKSFTEGRMDNNPVTLSKEEIKDILRCAL